MSSNSFIKDLLKQKRDTQIEFLPEFDLDKILLAICSFLNSEGGWVIVGHTGRELLGLPDTTEANLEELRHNINDRIFPQPLVYAQLDEFEDRRIVLVNVLKGSRQPYSLDKTYYIRAGKQSREANPDDISILLRTSNEYVSTWEKLTAIDVHFEDLDPEEIERTIFQANKIGKGQSLPINLQEFLSYFQLLDFNAVKNGAVVLFGRTPTRYFSQCRIRITMMPEGKTGSHYSDIEIIEDNLFISFNKVQDYFKRSLPMISEFKVDTWDRVSREKYPSDALDEAIVNAMVHRDYGDISGDITINIYRDKIEVINSGEIPPDIIRGKSTIEAHHSVLRNPTIAHMFYLRGKMEKLGRGLSLIKDRFVNLGLQAPEWSTQNGYTTLTLHSVPKKEKKIVINERMIRFLNQLEPGASFSREEYEKFFKGEISEKTARNDLAGLFDGGWLRRVGKGAATKYLKSDKELPDITGGR
jgi:ATP-dependent DNA helicase RecG